MKPATLELPIEIPAGVSSRDGFFHCGHCLCVVNLSQHEIDRAESAPAGTLVDLKCPKCKRWEVRWHFPTPVKQKVKPTVPVSQERGHELFARIFADLKN